MGGIITLNHLFQENDAFQFRTTYFYNRGKNEIFKTRGVNCVGNAADTNHVCLNPLEIIVIFQVMLFKVQS